MSPRHAAHSLPLDRRIERVDKYRNYKELSVGERRGQDYQIRARARSNSAWLVMAPHGGRIEPGTSEIAMAVARGVHSSYRFEGVKPSKNRDLHITSSRFDEPHALEMAASADSVIAIHGEASTQQLVFIGGRQMTSQNRLKSSLEARGFVVKRHPNQNLAGAAQSNICNRGRQGAGVQIELSLGVRRACFQSMSSTGRTIRTPTFRRLVAAIREGLNPGVQPGT